MKALKGQELSSYILEGGIYARKRQDCLKECMKYLDDESWLDGANKVLILYGLKLTGKKTLITNCILNLKCFDNCLRIICNENDTMSDITKAIYDSNCKYIFIEEITKISDFINTSSILYDLANSGKKIVITGTDSLGLYFASNNELFDSCIIVHTTLIPYKEWRDIYTDSADEYLFKGGIMTDESELSNEDEEYHTYIKEAIIDNITNSLTRWGNRNSRLLAKYNVAEIASATWGIIETISKDFVRKIMINNVYPENTGSLNKYLKRKQLTPIKETDVEDALKVSLYPESSVSKFSAEDIDILIEYLVKMDVIIKSKDNLILTQPILIYIQIRDILEPLWSKYIASGMKYQELRMITDKIFFIVKNQLEKDMMYIGLLPKYEITEISL